MASLSEPLALRGQRFAFTRQPNVVLPFLDDGRRGVGFPIELEGAILRPVQAAQNA
jgi:hypothetical protein